MTPATEVNAILAALRPLGNLERAAGEKRYLKSDLEFLGVSVPALRKTTRSWLRTHSGLTRQNLAALVRGLWRKRIHEARGVAILLLEDRQSLLALDDIDLLEDLLRRSKTWAYVDALAVHVVGPLVERSPGLSSALDRWAQDDDFWIRRSALLALLLPLRRGEGDWKRFVRYADAMLDEREFFIRKAIGWVLREHGKRRPERVAAFLKPRMARASGVTLREAVKYLPPGMIAKRTVAHAPRRS